MLGVIRGLFSVDRMLPEAKRLGEIPSTKQAYQDVIQIAMPSVMEMVLVSLVGSIDTMMVGTIGPEAITAVGLTGQPRMIVLCIFFALNIGLTAVVARRRGEGRQDKANEALRNALVVIAGLAVVMMVTILPFAGSLMSLAGAKEDTLEMSKTYFLIISYVLPFNAITLCINAAQRGVGNTRITMYVNIVSNAVNIVLNYLLIGGNFGFPRMGVAGAALATAIGFMAGFGLSLFSVISRQSVGRFLHLNFHSDWRLKKDTLAAIGKVGGSAMLEQLALRVGFFTYARFVADLGTLNFAAHQICSQFLNISYNFGDGIGVAGTSLVGQKLGQKRPDLATLYGKVSQRMAFVTALIIIAFVILLRYPLVSLFTKDVQVIDVAVQVMLVMAAFQPLQMSSVVVSGALRGAGDTLFVAIVMCVCVAIIRPILTYFAIHCLGLGLVGAWCASLIDMSIRVTLVYIRFNGGRWHNIKV